MIVTINTGSSAAISLRKEPDHEAEVIGTLTNGTQCTADTITGSWLHVTTPSGQQGYIAAAFVEGGVDGVWDSIKSAAKSAINKVKSIVTGNTSSASSGTKTMYVTGNKVNVRSAASTSSSSLTQLNKGTAVTVDTTKSVSGWNYITTSGGISGYMSTEYLSSTDPNASSQSNASSVSSKSSVKSSSATADTATVINDSNLNPNTNMSTTGNAKNYIKWGVIALAVTGIGYGLYKVFKSDDSAPAKSSKTKSQPKGLNGVGHKRHKKNGKKAKSAKRLPVKTVKF